MNEQEKNRDITFDTPDDVFNVVQPVEEETPVETTQAEPASEPEVEVKPEGTVEKQAEEPKPETEEEKQHRKSGIQRLKEQRNRERAAREQLEREIAELRARQSSIQEPDGKPVRPNEDQFETYDAYQAAQEDYQAKLVEFTVIQREKKALRETEEARAKEIGQYQQARIASFHAAHPDLGDLLANLDQQRIPFTPQMRTIIDDSDVGGEILHFLAKNPEEIVRIAALPVGKQMKELGLLEDRFDEPQKPTQPTVKQTHAPKPITPVRGGTVIPRTRDGDYELY